MKTTALDNRRARHARRAHAARPVTPGQILMGFLFCAAVLSSSWPVGHVAGSIDGRVIDPDAVALNAQDAAHGWEVASVNGEVHFIGGGPELVPAAPAD